MVDERLGKKPDIVFEMTGVNNHKINVEIYVTVPFELARSLEIRQYIEGERYPDIDFLYIDKAMYTGEYVVTDLQCLAIFVAKDKEHFMHLLKERVLPHYDGDLVRKIEVILK